jgi:HlyD family secretion protein
MSRAHRPRWAFLIVVLLVLGAAGGAGWWGAQRAHLAEPLLDSVRDLLEPRRLPPDITSTHGRLEATEIDVATKLPGRLDAVFAQEGDMVAAGAVLARLDTTILDAQLRQARAEVRRAQQDRAYAQAIVDQRRSELQYARNELQRTLGLARRELISEERVDQAQTQALSAEAALRAAQVKVAETEAAIEAAAAQVERIEAEIDESALRAPLRGRVLYRLAEPGEVLGAGGKVLTLLDLTDVYMVLFLPETVAGRVAIGAEARLVLDAAPEYVIPATVSFVAARAQFTPKQVETRSEREKLAFRVKARIDPQLLAAYEPLVKTGVPGVAYIALGREVTWPDWLAPRLP